MRLVRRAALVLLFVASLPAVTPRLYASDEIQYFAFLRSLWFDRDLSFENEYRYFYDRGIARAHGFHATFLELESATGLRLNFGTIGSALLWAPMYAVADAGVRVARALGSPVEADGFSRPYLAAVAYGSAIYGFLAILLSAFVARRIVGNGRLAAVVIWVGTPLLFYMYLAPGMAHATSAFSVAAFVTTWLLVRDRWSVGGMAALGALTALMTMVREQDAFFAVGPAIDFLWTLAEDRRAERRVLASRATAAAAGVMAFGVCFLPQALAYLVLNGHIGPDIRIANKMYWYAPHSLQVILSPRHGFFFWTPLALVAIAGLVSRAMARSPDVANVPAARRITVCLIAMFLAQVYVSGSVDSWTVAGSFGQRRFVGTSVLLVVGLAALLHQATGWRRHALSAIIVLCIWWNLALMAQFGAGMMDRQRLQLGRNVYNTFITVPAALPDLAYRYFFSRSSFYRPPDAQR